MRKDNNIANRISQEYQINRETYLLGLFDVQRRLFNELVCLLKIEDRAFGVMKNYIRTCQESFSSLEKTEEEQDTYDRILYLLKPVLIKEFKRLTKRRLSPADAVITLLHRVFDILLEVSEDEEWEALLEVKGVIDKLWKNIKNRSKKDSLYYYSNLIRDLITEGIIGRYPLSSISFREEKEKELLRNPGVRFKEDSPNKIIEINLM